MLNSFKKNLYYMFFSIFKYIRYPTCNIKTNHVHPTTKIGIFVQIERYCKIDKNVEIGDYTYINEYTRIDANTNKIGKYCSISHNVKIGLGPHPSNFVSTSPIFYSKQRSFAKINIYDEYADKGYTDVGHDVLVGANSIILAGVNVGTGAVIGAGSVVIKDVEPYSIVAGNPAKIIKYRFTKEIIDKLLQSQWWESEANYLLKKYNMCDIESFLKQINTNDDF